MAQHTHIHLHLAPGMFGAESTADGFEESKHARTGGKFSSSNGGSGAGASKPATGAAAYAAKHKGQGENAQEKLDKSREENPIL